MSVPFHISPRLDLAVLARDVDRLFRARQCRKATPVGTGWDSAGGWVWKPADEERDAALVFGPPRDQDSCCGPCERMRTRRHAAALALVAPAFFASRMADLDRAEACLQEAFARALSDRCGSRLRGIPPPDLAGMSKRFGLDGKDMDRLATDFVNGRPAPLPVAGPRASDVTRTFRYLVDLDRRLRDRREAEVEREAIARATEPDPEAEAEAAWRARDMAAAEEDGDLAALLEEAT